MPASLSEKVIALFRQREIDAVVVGKVLEETKVILKARAEAETLFDFQKDKITGIVYSSNPDNGTSEPGKETRP